MTLRKLTPVTPPFGGADGASATAVRPSPPAAPGCLREGARSYAKPVPAPRRGLPGERGPRSGDAGFGSGVPRRPARRRRATRSSSWPAGWFAYAGRPRRTCGPGPLRPWRFFAEPVRHRRASRSASAGYARVSKSDGYQSLDLQRDALRAAGVDDAVNLYHDFASGLRDDRPGLDTACRSCGRATCFMVWKLDRLGRNLAHLVVVSDLRPLAGEHTRRPTPLADRSCTVFDPRPAGSCSASSRRWPSSSGS